jgi:hypothetical protein
LDRLRTPKDLARRTRYRDGTGKRSDRSGGQLERHHGPAGTVFGIYQGAIQLLVGRRFDDASFSFGYGQR